MVLQSQQTAWRRTNTHETWYQKPRHITRLRWRQAGCLCEKGEWRSGGNIKRCNPTLWRVGTPWYHLSVFLNSQKAQETRVLHKPYPAWLCADELILPQTLIVILSWCRGICRAPTAKPTAGLSGRWGSAVFTCVLRQGTGLTVHTGLQIKPNFQSLCC